jgi:hypothetical protein
MIQVVMIGSHAPLQRWVGKLVDIDFSPLMQTWEKVVVEDNRKGVLSGLDAFDQPMPPLAYRFGSGSATSARSGTAFGTVVKRFKGFSTYTGGKRFKRKPFPGVSVMGVRPNRGKRGPWPPGGKSGDHDRTRAILPNNNLSTPAYQQLTGPRLAPRREASRVITNYHTRYGRDAIGWFAEGEWVDVVSADGVPFLEAHFDGVGVPQYDLRGVRRWGLAEASAAVDAFLRKKLRDTPGYSGDFTSEWGQTREVFDGP